MSENDSFDREKNILEIDNFLFCLTCYFSDRKRLFDINQCAHDRRLVGLSSRMKFRVNVPSSIKDHDWERSGSLGAQWLSGFEPHRRHCVVSLSKNINPSLVLVQPRKKRPFITERLLMRRIKNQIKQKKIIDHDIKPGE